MIHSSDTPLKRLATKAAAFLLGGLVFGAASATADIGVVNGLTHERISEPGERYETIIILKNFGTSAGRMRLYKTDFVFNADGQQEYGDPGGHARSNAAWIEFFPSQVRLEPEETAEVRCVVTVPDGDELTGTYWSLIMAEALPDETKEGEPVEEGQVQMGIRQVVRYGVQIVTHIQETGSREIRFLKTDLLAENGKTILEVDVENTGERWLRPILYVELFDEAANPVGKFEAGRLRIFPTTSVRYRVDLTAVPRGRYKAMVVVDNQDEYVFGAELTLNLIPAMRLP